MRKLLKFLSIGILSSSVTTSVVACNNNEQKNLNKNDEHIKKIKEKQYQINKTEKEIIEQILSKKKFLKESEALGNFFKGLNDELEMMELGQKNNNFELHDLYKIEQKLKDIIEKITKLGMDLQQVKQDFKLSKELNEKWEYVVAVFKDLNQLAKEKLQFFQNEISNKIKDNSLHSKRITRETKSQLDDSQQDFDQLKSLEVFNERLKTAVKKYNFYIKDDAKKSVNKENSKEIIVRAFFDVKSKMTNHKEFNIINTKFTLTKNKDECKIDYILEKSLLDESVIVKKDSVFIKINKILVNEFKDKLTAKLLNTNFQIVRKQLGKNESLRTEVLRRQVQEVVNDLNQEQKYDFIFNKINIISVERNSRFNVNIIFSKKLENSLCKFNLESFYIFLPFEFK